MGGVRMGRKPVRVASTAVRESQEEGRSDHLGRDLTLYVGARVALIAIVALILTVFGIPLLVSIAVGIVVALPLTLVLLRPLNSRVSAELADRGARRRAERDKLRAQLRGADGSGEDPETGPTH